MLDKFGIAGPALAPLSPWHTIQVPVSMLVSLSAETTSATNKNAVKLLNLNSASKKPSSSIYSALKKHDSKIKVYTTLEYIYMFSAYMFWRQQRSSYLSLSGIMEVTIKYFIRKAQWAFHGLYPDDNQCMFSPQVQPWHVSFERI